MIMISRTNSLFAQQSAETGEVGLVSDVTGPGQGLGSGMRWEISPRGVDGKRSPMGEEGQLWAWCLISHPAASVSK